MSIQSYKHTAPSSADTEEFVDVPTLTNLMTNLATTTEPDADISKIGKPTVTFKDDSVDAVPALASPPFEGTESRRSSSRKKRLTTRDDWTDPEYTDISTMPPGELRDLTKNLQSLLRQTKHQVDERKEEFYYAQSQINHLMHDVELLSDYSITVDEKWAAATKRVAQLSSMEADLYQVRRERDLLVSRNTNLSSACTSFHEAMSALLKANEEKSTAQSTWYPPPPPSSLPPTIIDVQLSGPAPPPPPLLSDYMFPAIRPQLSTRLGSELSQHGVHAVPDMNNDSEGEISNCF